MPLYENFKLQFIQKIYAYKRKIDKTYKDFCFFLSLHMLGNVSVLPNHILLTCAYPTTLPQLWKLFITSELYTNFDQ